MTFSVDFDACEIALEQTLDSYEQVKAHVERLWGAAMLLWPEDSAAHDAELAAASAVAKKDGSQAKGEDGLTNRQRGALGLLKEGLTPVEIADRLGMAKSGISAMRKRFIEEGRL